MARGNDKGSGEADPVWVHVACDKNPTGRMRAHPPCAVRRGQHLRCQDSRITVTNWVRIRSKSKAQLRSLTESIPLVKCLQKPSKIRNGGARLSPNPTASESAGSPVTLLRPWRPRR